MPAMSATLEPAPAPASDSLQDAILLTERLADLVEAENQMLASRRPAALAAGSDEKHRLTALYGRAMAALRAEPERLRRAAPAEMARLRGSTERFRSCMEEHGRRIQVMKTVTEGLIRAVGNEAAGPNRPLAGYDRHALAAPLVARAASRPTSVALDQRI